ncbi:hypothetical protein CTI14_65420, partial [Methylobacterium radiotolerans]
GEAYGRGGPQMVCVRTCDGGFFPMKNLPEGRGARKRELQGLVASTCPPRRNLRGSGEAYGRGGPQMVCVRTCDGGFFPMKNLPEGRG